MIQQASTASMMLQLVAIGQNGDKLRRGYDSKKVGSICLHGEQKELMSGHRRSSIFQLKVLGTSLFSFCATTATSPTIECTKHRKIHSPPSRLYTLPHEYWEGQPINRDFQPNHPPTALMDGPWPRWRHRVVAHERNLFARAAERVLHRADRNAHAAEGHLVVHRQDLAGKRMVEFLVG